MKQRSWSIFAERGMGYFSAASTSDDLNPIEDFSLPTNCATSDCATVSGTVKDKVTGKAAAGVTVAVPGLDSGFASYSRTQRMQRDTSRSLTFRSTRTTCFP